MKYIYTLLIFSLSFGAYAQETVIAVWDFTENTLGVTEFNSDFSTLNSSAAVGDNNLGFFGVQLIK